MPISNPLLIGGVVSIDLSPLEARLAALEVENEAQANAIAALEAENQQQTSAIAALQNQGGTPTPSPSPSPYIAEAQAVIDAILLVGGTLSTAQKDACNAHISTLKSNGIWGKLSGYYGLLGGTDASHRINWKNPNLYNLGWNGNFEHSALGVRSLGGYATTGYSFKDGFLSDSVHFGVYCRTNSMGRFCDMGGLEYAGGALRYMGLFLRWEDGSLIYNSDSGGNSFSNPSSLGHFIASQTPTNKLSVFGRSTTLHSSTPSGSMNAANVDADLHLFNRHVNVTSGSASPIYYLSASDRQYASFHWGLGLSSQEALIFLEAEQSYQQKLNRAV